MLVPQDVVRLDITVHDRGVQLMQVNQHIEELVGELEELFTAGTPAILDPIGQRLSRSERLGQIKTSAFSAILVLGLEGVEVARNRRVRETSQHLGLSLEELEALAGLTLDELVSDDEDIEGGESSDEALRESEDEEEAEEPEEASPRQRSFWMARSVTTADAQSEDEHKEVAPRRPRRESSIIRGIRVEDEVLLLLEGANREVEADDLAAIKAAAEPLLRLLRARHIID